VAAFFGITTAPN